MLDRSRHELTVADRLAIRELVDRYNDAINHRDWPMLATLFAPDAVWEIAAPVHLRLEGAPKIAGGIRWAVSRQEVLVQVTSAVVIESSAPDRATVRSTMTEFSRVREGDAGMQSVGTFYDQVSKLDGAWCFAQRLFRVRYSDIVPAPARLPEDRAS